MICMADRSSLLLQCDIVPAGCKPADARRSAAPPRPRELKRHDCLTCSYLPTGDSWRCVEAAGQEAAVTVEGRLGATNGDALPSALAAGRLVAVMRAWNPAPTAIHPVTPAGGPRPPGIAVLLDFLARRFAPGAVPWTAALPEP